MANNKNTKTINSQILLNKVAELSNRLKLIHQSAGVGQTQNELIIEVNKLLSGFFTQLSSPLFNPIEVKSNTKPDPTEYNENLSAIMSDLRILFAELNNISNIILSNFNFMISDTNRLLGKLKSSYSKLGDYILFSNDPNKDSIFFTDSFNNLDRIDFNSKLISTTQAEVDQSQGIITLPIDTKALVPIVITSPPAINNNSNGTPGNNYEKNAVLNNDITAVLDNNADTWFEYEKVIVNEQDDFKSLVLDVTLNLEQSKIVNYIRINPNNFGTTNPLVIDAIETSVDGKYFVNVKDDIPLAGFQSNNEENLFAIDSSTSKFAGQGIYTFTPRFAKYIHLVFKQNNPYTILDSTNTVRRRYAIGIRDIQVSAIPFLDTGEIISTSYPTEEEIKKVAVISHQFPESDISLMSIEHYVSGDEGLTWTRINPVGFVTFDTTISSLVNFNTLDNNSVNTTPSVQSLKYKAVLKRNDESFNDPSSFKNAVIQNVSELHPIPAGTPFDLTLKNSPVKDSIKVVDPAFGSRGVETNRYQIGIGNGTSISFMLPYAPIKKDIFKDTQLAYAVQEEIDSQIVRVNGQIWTRGPLSLAGPTYEVYELNYATGEIKFGDGVNGKAVPQGATIDIIFNRERLHISSDDKHIAELDYPTSNDKKSFTIEGHGAIVTTSETLKRGITKHILGHNNILEVNFSDLTVFATYVTFIDGESELLADGYYTIDYSNGIVYSRTPSNYLTDTTATYRYIPTFTLMENDWDFVKDSGYKKISINKNALTSIDITNEVVQSDTKYFVLQNLSILQGTLYFSGIDSEAIFFKEVPFVDGQSELIKGTKTIESIGALSVGALVEYVFRTPIAQSTDLKVEFSNTSVFTTLVGSLGGIDAPGKYYINRAANKVTVYVASAVEDAGTVGYYYNDLMKSNTGLYSVNYKTGEVYTATATSSGLTAKYNYTDYIAKYNISREITNFTYDDSTNTVNISEQEILFRLNITKSNSTQTNFYQILYDKIRDNREELKALAPYFSPVLRDYALKIILESSLLF